LPTTAYAQALILPPPTLANNCIPPPSLQVGLAYIDYCRAVYEGIGPVVLPSNYGKLSGPEQMFVIADLERVDRGEPPAIGLSASLDSYAQTGANDDTDPGFPLSGFSSGGSIWAGGYPTSEYAFYGWMYDDGPGSGNLACTPTDTSGCWGHRNIILFGPSEADIVAGSAMTGASYAMEFLGGYPTKDLVFTWASELGFFASPPGSERLRPPIIRSIAPDVAPGLGGSSAEIAGTNLSATSAVYFGTTPARFVSCSSDTSVAGIGW
jgi:hypothetical protein